VLTGGVLTGGVLTGGALTGGALTGGVLTGGVLTGGVLTGGVPAGGVAGLVPLVPTTAASLGARFDSTNGLCVVPDPPTQPMSEMD
jgi:hypothetical protein